MSSGCLEPVSLRPHLGGSASVPSLFLSYSEALGDSRESHSSCLCACGLGAGEAGEAHPSLMPGPCCLTYDREYPDGNRFISHGPGGPEF